MSTRTPCPECGKVNWQRERGQICPACKRLIAEAKERRKTIEESKEEVVRKMPHAPHGFPYLYETGEDGRNVQRYIYQLALESSVASESNYNSEPLIKCKDGYGFSADRVFLVRIAPLFQELYTAIEAAVKAAHDAGIEQMRHHFQQYCKGKETEENFVKAFDCGKWLAIKIILNPINVEKEIGG